MNKKNIYSAVAAIVFFFPAALWLFLAMCEYTGPIPYLSRAYQAYYAPLEHFLGPPFFQRDVDDIIIVLWRGALAAVVVYVPLSLLLTFLMSQAWVRKKRR